MALKVDNLKKNPIITSPAGAVAKYCDERVCVSVCLSARIYTEPRARSLLIFVHVAYGRGSVLLWQGDEIPRRSGNFRGSVPEKFDNCNIPNNNCELDWSMQRRADDRGRRFIAGVGRGCYLQRRGVAHRRRSVISTIAVFLILCIELAFLADVKLAKSCVTYTGQKIRLPLDLSLLRGSRPISARASPHQCAPDFIQTGSLSA